MASSQQTKSIRSMSSANLAGEVRRRRVIASSAASVAGRPLQNPEPAGFPPQVPDQAVVGHPVEPRARVVGKALRPSRP